MVFMTFIVTPLLASERTMSEAKLFAAAASDDIGEIRKLLAGGADIGELVSVYVATGFALVRLDRLEETSGEVRAGEIPVELKKPAWLA